MLLETSTTTEVFIHQSKIAKEVPKIYKPGIHFKATQLPLHVPYKTTKSFVNIHNNDVIDDMPTTSIMQFSKRKNYNQQSITELKDIISRPEIKTSNGTGLHLMPFYHLILLYHVLKVVSGHL